MMHAVSFYPRAIDETIQSELCAGSFRLSSDDHKAELRILPIEQLSVLRDTDDIHHFEIEMPRQNEETAGCSLEASAEPAGLFLSIHSQFLGYAGRRPMRSSTQGIVAISDAVAVELAHGLLRAESTNLLSGHARSCAVVMLCDRIDSLLNRSGGMSSHRFQEWQISVLDEVLSGSIDEVSSVESVAARCHLSVCHFSRLFKAAYGIPFHKFLMQERIKRSQSQLVDSEVSISQIALDCGFSDQSCFTRRFTIATGSPPASWRKQAKRAKVAGTKRPVLAPTYPFETRVA